MSPNENQLLLALAEAVIKINPTDTRAVRLYADRVYQELEAAYHAEQEAALLSDMFSRDADN